MVEENLQELHPNLRAAKYRKCGKLHKKEDIVTMFG